jgi:hypothetical protein
MQNRTPRLTRWTTGIPAVDPVEPEPPPDDGEQAPEVTTTSDARCEKLAPSQTDATSCVLGNNRATTSVSPECRPQLKIRTEETEATSASGVSSSAVTDCRLDNRANATTCETNPVEPLTDSPPSRTPTMPISGSVVPKT